MAYSGNNLSLLKSINDGSWNMWVYRSADAQATVAAANYITDGAARGMKVLDLVFVVDTNVPTISMHSVVSINATTDAVDLAAGTTVSVS